VSPVVLRLLWGRGLLGCLTVTFLPSVFRDTWERMELTTRTHSETLFHGKTAGQRLIEAIEAFRKGRESLVLDHNYNVRYVRIIM
jgi:hypothetical protein